MAIYPFIPPHANEILKRRNAGQECDRSPNGNSKGWRAAMNSFFDQPIILDCTGLRCPLPILQFRKAAKTIKPGQTLILLSDDPNTHRDFAAFCRAAGHVLLTVEEQAGGWRFLVQPGCAAETGGE